MSNCLGIHLFSDNKSKNNCKKTKNNKSDHSSLHFTNTSDIKQQNTITWLNVNKQRSLSYNRHNKRPNKFHSSPQLQYAIINQRSLSETDAHPRSKADNTSSVSSFGNTQLYTNCGSNTTHLGTALVQISVNQNKSAIFIVLLDSASQSTIITTECLTQFGVNYVPSNIFINGFASRSTSIIGVGKVFLRWSIVIWATRGYYNW